MRTVLVVDDHADTTDVLVETLRLDGWYAMGVHTADEALRVARAARIDIVVTDLLLPVLGGEELERAFREDPALSHIPFVFITGFAPAVQRLGAHRVLLKPFPASELHAALVRALAGRTEPLRSI